MEKMLCSSWLASTGTAPTPMKANQQGAHDAHPARRHRIADATRSQIPREVPRESDQHETREDHDHVERVRSAHPSHSQRREVVLPPELVFGRERARGEEQRQQSRHALRGDVGCQPRQRVRARSDRAAGPEPRADGGVSLRGVGASEEPRPAPSAGPRRPRCSTTGCRRVRSSAGSRRRRRSRRFRKPR